MVKPIRYIVILVCTLCLTTARAEWISHLAYNNVTQIAMSADEVYALSDGNLYSVNKLSEKMQTHFAGLHGTGITSILYDTQGEQLIIGYATGKIDLLSRHGVKYISELYEKDMTQRKSINNITIDGRLAYFSTPYGVQTFDLDARKLVDSYWLRPGGEETEVIDVLLSKDSIYAFTSDSLFSASRKTNIVDYTFWKREKRSSRVQPDPDKGRYYTDELSQWYAGGKEGIVRLMINERNAYKPQSPLNNVPYGITASQGDVWVVSGGRWASQYSTPGVVMRYDGQRWTNIETSSIAKTSSEAVLDFLNVAVDPRDKKHYFITSFGTGLYEFYADTIVRHIIAGEDNTLVSLGNAKTYTRTDVASFDSENNLWLMSAAGRSQLQCLDASGNWHAINLQDGNSLLEAFTPSALFIDRNHPNYKWIGIARLNPCVYLLDDNGTRFDESDDRYKCRSTWTNQNGHPFAPTEIRTIIQDSQGRVWIGTDLGAAYMDHTDFFTSDAITQPDVMDEATGENPLTSMTVYAMCEDREGNIWIGTENLGVYVLDHTATQIIAHYTSANSTMPANSVLSLACDERGSVFVGTGSGLAQYKPDHTPESTDRTVDEEGRRLGSVMQWKLHYSYQNPTEIIPTSSRMYALAEGALFYVSRDDDEVHYLSKASGLNGSTATKAAYDPLSKRLVVAYEDGRIDLVNESGYIQQMPDVHMKANSISTVINCITPGSKNTYLGMSFGILAINTKKGEVSDTYYIGDEASDVDVRFIAEMDGTLYAFRKDSFFYHGEMSDNLVDYHYWYKRALPKGTLTHAAVFKDKLYILVNNTLYCRQSGAWVKATSLSIKWMHVHDDQMVVWINGQGVCRLSDTYQPSPLTNQYAANDGVYSNGEYWLAEEDKGLVRLGTEGDDTFLPNGPLSNYGYFLCSKHGRVYATVGGRWAAQYGRPPKVSIYDGQNWTGIPSKELLSPDGALPLDPVSIAVDNNDPNHFYVASYDAGLYEYNNGSITRYGDGLNGSTITAIIPSNPNSFTRTDGAMMDASGNLWVLNATNAANPGIHVMTPNHTWGGLRYRDGSQSFGFATPKGTWTDRRSANYIWCLDQRIEPGVILIDHRGTPTINSDDRFIKRTEFIDQNGVTVKPSFFYCWEQDRNDRIWIGTESGIILIPTSVDFFTSNSCERIIIPRRDGSGLGDYLLGEETINCMAVDGGNRMWIGTAGSGLYVIEDDTITVAHFTENNSLLPSDAIQSITIVPETGEVFVGTDRGIASYLSDASEPSENMKEAYAYPNPVRPDYAGSIAITKLMENSEVNIIDSGGNLVCKTRSHGGTAVWNGRLPDGQLAKAGIYTALCNAKGGHAAVKIMIIR